MTNNSKKQLIDRLVNVTVAMTELLLLVEKDKFALDLFEKGVQTTGALPVSLDDFLAEWQTVVNNVTLDALALYECWLKSAKFYRDISSEHKNLMHLDDMKVESNDIVFEDGAYITCGIIKNELTKAFEIRYYVELGRDCSRFKEFNEAAKFLWDNHSKEGYGV
jgi:hypothetical protein